MGKDGVYGGTGGGGPDTRGGTDTGGGGGGGGDTTSPKDGTGGQSQDVTANFSQDAVADPSVAPGSQYQSGIGGGGPLDSSTLGGLAAQQSGGDIGGFSGPGVGGESSNFGAPAGTFGGAGNPPLGSGAGTFDPTGSLGAQTALGGLGAGSLGVGDLLMTGPGGGGNLLDPLGTGTGGNLIDPLGTGGNLLDPLQGLGVGAGGGTAPSASDDPSALQGGDAPPGDAPPGDVLPPGEPRTTPGAAPGSLAQLAQANQAGTAPTTTGQGPSGTPGDNPPLSPLPVPDPRYVQDSSDYLIPTRYNAVLDSLNSGQDIMRPFQGMVKAETGLNTSGTTPEIEATLNRAQSALMGNRPADTAGLSELTPSNTLAAEVTNPGFFPQRTQNTTAGTSDLGALANQQFTDAMMRAINSPGPVGAATDVGSNSPITGKPVGVGQETFRATDVNAGGAANPERFGIGTPDKSFGDLIQGMNPSAPRDPRIDASVNAGSPQEISKSPGAPATPETSPGPPQSPTSDTGTALATGAPPSGDTLTPEDIAAGPPNPYGPGGFLDRFAPANDIPSGSLSELSQLARSAPANEARAAAAAAAGGDQAGNAPPIDRVQLSDLERLLQDNPNLSQPPADRVQLSDLETILPQRAPYNAGNDPLMNPPQSQTAEGFPAPGTAGNYNYPSGGLPPIPAPGTAGNYNYPSGGLPAIGVGTAAPPPSPGDSFALRFIGTLGNLLEPTPDVPLPQPRPDTFAQRFGDSPDVPLPPSRPATFAERFGDFPSQAPDIPPSRPQPNIPDRTGSPEVTSQPPGSPSAPQTSPGPPQAPASNTGTALATGGLPDRGIGSGPSNREDFRNFPLSSLGDLGGLALAALASGMLGQGGANPMTFAAPVTFGPTAPQQNQPAGQAPRAGTPGPSGTPGPPTLPPWYRRRPSQPGETQQQRIRRLVMQRQREQNATTSR